MPLEYRSDIVLTEESSPDEPTIRAFKEGVDDFNFAAAGPDGYAAFWIIGRDVSGAVRAGAHGSTSWEWLFLDWLWVHESLRHHGIGSDLMERAEKIAREQKCRGVFLNTYSFQAPRFYQRLGYEEFGRLADMPPGHTRIWFAKRL
ncbi:MAG: GNAT family N-acetyltransferase [Candidatus Eremiobacteraeota bacterium]|nr:GNAT family N-acetyltransferase [Candidatus Eremiobacteraeota bacterium]